MNRRPSGQFPYQTTVNLDMRDADILARMARDLDVSIGAVVRACIAEAMLSRARVRREALRAKNAAGR